MPEVWLIKSEVFAFLNQSELLICCFLQLSFSKHDEGIYNLVIFNIVYFFIFLIQSLEGCLYDLATHPLLFFSIMETFLFIQIIFSCLLGARIGPTKIWLRKRHVKRHRKYFVFEQIRESRLTIVANNLKPKGLQKVTSCSC